MKYFSAHRIMYTRFIVHVVLHYPLCIDQRPFASVGRIWANVLHGHMRVFTFPHNF